MNNEIFVESEWAELRECIYGWADDLILPRFLQDAEVRPEGEMREFWQRHQGRRLAEADPELFGRFKEQVDGAVDFLRGRGITVHQPKPHSPQNRKYPRGENHGSMTAWMRDPFVTIGRNVMDPPWNSSL